MSKYDASAQVFSIDSMAYNLLLHIFEPTPIAFVVIDKDERIRVLNRAYSQYLGVEAKDYIGKHITELIGNSRMPLVMKTQKAELSQHHVYIDGPAKGQQGIVHRIPIIENGGSTGCMGMIVFQSIDELMRTAAKNKQLSDELNYYKKELQIYQTVRYTIDDILGNSAAMGGLKRNIYKIASSKATVFIQGESGTGKELVAHALHTCSDRHGAPFVKINCAAIPDNLFESELFGYEEGSFTGAAKSGRKGKFEAANGGTLFLDEVGELPPFMQAKLLRVLQEKEIVRVGGTKNIPVDVRVISATNRNLEQMVKEDKFREDLYFRLNVLNVRIPPLRERKEDLRILIPHYLEQLAKENGIYKSLSPQVYSVFDQYNWKGNVRELSNVLEKMFFSSETDMLELKDVPPSIMRAVGTSVNLHSGRSLDIMVEGLEQDMVKMAMEKTGNNITKAAEMLQISRPRLYRILGSK